MNAVRREKSKALAVVPAKEVETVEEYPIGKGDLHFTHVDALKHKILSAAKAVHDARIKIKAKSGSRNGRYEQAFSVERQREFYQKIKQMSGHIRHHHLVYGFFYDLPYRKMEDICYTNPDWDAFENIARSYWAGPDQNLEQKLQEWFDGAKSRTLITQNKYNDKPRAGQALSVSFQPAKKKKGPRYTGEQRGQLNKAFNCFVRAIRKADAARHDQAS